MKISVDISPEHTEPYAVIYTSQMTDEIQRLIEVFGNSVAPLQLRTCFSQQNAL